MAVFSKKLCEKKVKMWSEAEDAITTGQSYQIGTRMLTRANLKDVQEALERWAGRLAAAEAEERSGGRIQAYRFVPRDM